MMTEKPNGCGITAIPKSKNNGKVESLATLDEVQDLIVHGEKQRHEAGEDMQKLEAAKSTFERAETDARSVWERLTAEMQRCHEQRLTIAARKIDLGQQLLVIYKKQAAPKKGANGGKYINNR